MFYHITFILVPLFWTLEFPDKTRSCQWRKACTVFKKEDYLSKLYEIILHEVDKYGNYKCADLIYALFCILHDWEKIWKIFTCMSLNFLCICIYFYVRPHSSHLLTIFQRASKTVKVNLPSPWMANCYATFGAQPSFTKQKWKMQIKKNGVLPLQ